MFAWPDTVTEPGSPVRITTLDRRGHADALDRADVARLGDDLARTPATGVGSGAMATSPHAASDAASDGDEDDELEDPGAGRA